MAPFDLTGKIAVVTGGNRGIGFAIARGLASAGAAVVSANRNAETGRRAAAELANAGLPASAFQADVSRRAPVDSLVAHVLGKYGRLDILVNSAGVIDRGPVEEFTEAQWDRIMEINLKGLFFCCQAVGRVMIPRRKGKIINISSNVCDVVQPGRAVYAASKAGVSHLTRGFALEWARYRINVNAIGPGPTLTELNQQFFADNPKDLQARLDAIPLGRLGRPDDHVGAAVFLASEASDFITGQTLLIDGGSNLW
jgi:2-deoxy-D-gluconate 3-dehydrogenase